MTNKNAKVTKVEVVNGSMLTITLALPAGQYASNFTDAVKGVLNTTRTVINSWDIDQDIQAGYELTTDGEVIECAVTESREATELQAPEGVDYRDAFQDKMNGN